MHLTARASSLSPTSSGGGGTKLSAPRCIIRSTHSYHAQTAKELSFEKGEFFHVVERENDPVWFDACNPLTGRRGLVPVALFEVMETRQERMRRTQRSMSTVPGLQSNPVTPVPTSQSDIFPHSHHASVSSPSRTSLGISRSFSNMSAGMQQTHSPLMGSSPPSQRRPSEGATLVEGMSSMSLRSRAASTLHQRQTSSTGQSPVPSVPAQIQLYGTMLYDFEAETSDEISLKAEESVLIVAQSTEDWFVAKSAMRACAPGLVPVAYVKLHDHISGGAIDDLQVYLRRYHLRLPSVAEWKKKSLATRSSRSSGTAGSDTASSNSIEGQSTPPGSTTGNRESILGQWPPQMKPRTRARTASSSTSSIADRSSLRPLHKGRQASASSLQYLAMENLPPFHPQDLVSASVPTFICKDGAYLFLISLKFKTGDERNLYRGYDDFVHFHIQLTDLFPDDMKRLASPHFLNANMASGGYVNDGIAEKRRSDIDDYVQGLMNMPQPVVINHVFQRMFGSGSSSTGAPLNRTPSTRSHTTSPASYQTQHVPSLSVDSGVDTGSTHSTSPKSAARSSTVLSPAEAILSSTRSALAAKYGERGSMQPPSRSPPRIVHKSSTLTLVGNIPMIKVKVRVGGDMVAMRLPSTLGVDQIKARIAEKLEHEDFAAESKKFSRISYCSPSGESMPLNADVDWKAALEVTNNKPVLTLVQ